MRYAALIIAYNEHELIEAHLRQYPKWVKKILVLASKSPWNGERSEKESQMFNILNDYPDHRIEVVSLDWKNEHEQRNWGLARLYDYDIVLTLDPDEFIDDWDLFHGNLEREEDKNVFVSCETITYWKDKIHVFGGSDGHKPVVATKPSSLFFDKREIDDTRFELLVKLYHLSWVKSPESIWQKINNYSHSKDFNKEEWFNEWKYWSPGKIARLPLSKEPVRIVEHHLPDNIKSLFD